MVFRDPEKTIKADDQDQLQISDRTGAEAQTEQSDLHPNHPLLWPSWLRHACLLQLSYNAMMNGFTSAILIPGIPALAQALNVGEQTASYLASVSVLFLGIGPFFMAPLADRYGRRACFIAATLLSFVSSIGGGYARTYSTLMAARVFQALGVSIGNVFGAAIVAELFPAEHRAAKMNIWSVMITTGPAIGGLVGGFLIAALGWRWAFYLNAICTGAELLAYVFAFPETQWVPSRPLGLRARMGLPGNPEMQIRPVTFLMPLLYLQNPAMIIVLLAFGLSFGIVSVGLSVTLPAVFVPIYGFGAREVGLVFVAYIIGALLGGQVGGRFSDMVANRYKRQCIEQGRLYRYEYRLLAVIPGYVLVVAGLVIYGVTLQKKTHWSGPVVAIGIASCGLQIVTNVLNTYCVDCYRSEALKVTIFLNAFRQVLGFSAPFWIPPLIAASGYGLGVGALAIICFVFYMSTTVVFMKGEWIRQRFPVRGLEKS